MVSLGLSSIAQDAADELQWLEWMKSAGLSPDVVSYNTILKRSAKKYAETWETTLQLLADMATAQVDANIITLNTVIDACLQSHQRGVALNLAMNLEKWGLMADEVTVASVLRAFQDKGAWQTALSLLFGMPDLDLEANNYCFAGAMTSCSNSGEWEWTLHLLHTIELGAVQPDAACYAAAIGACGESEQWERALHLLNKMPRASIAPNAACFTAALASFKTPQEWELCLEVLTLMTSIGLPPNRVHWNAAMSTCASSSWQQAFLLMDTMQSLHIPADTDTLGVAIEAFRTAAFWQHALSTFRSISDLQVRPDLRSYNNVLNALNASSVSAAIWSEAVEQGVYPKLLERHLAASLELPRHAQATTSWICTSSRMALLSMRYAGG